MGAPGSPSRVGGAPSGGHAAHTTSGGGGAGAVNLTFRVRCDGLGHGESVFLCGVSAGPHRGIPMYTTEEEHPWYSTDGPVPLAEGAVVSPHHGYKYAIHVAGAFSRWEANVDRRRFTLAAFEPGEFYVLSDVLGDRRTGTLVGAHTGEKIEHFRPARRSITFRKTKQEREAEAEAARPVPDPASVPGAPHAASDYTLSSTDGVVVASAFLPVVLHRSPAGGWSADWDYENLLSMDTHLRVTRVGTVKWRGWHGNHGADGSPEAGVPEEERPAVEACLEKFGCVPVWCDTRSFGLMYNGFCKGMLWPIFHNVSSVYGKGGAGGALQEHEADAGKPRSSSVDEKDSGFETFDRDDEAGGFAHGDGRGRQAELWAAYTDVNRQFADTIVQCFNEKDLVWVHGFHLLVLPSYLTRRIPMAKIGLFMHTPFPSSEIFRTLWCREDLLRGMLNADQVGFHLYEYARHFLTCCRRLLGLNYGMFRDSYEGHNMVIESHGRTVTVTSIHAGIEPPVLQQFLTHPSTHEMVASIRSQFHGRTVLVGIDRLESLKGIPLKMLGLERFLSRRPHWVGRLVLVQVGISAYERGDDYVRTKREVLAMAGAINQRWPGTIQFRECAESEMRLSQRIALLRSADMVLVTSLRDGLNRLPLEFTMAHQDAVFDHRGQRPPPDGRRRGICILSEFASATRVMRGAIHVNPWKISEIALALDRALNMGDEERLRRLQYGCEYVARVTTQRWALAVLLDLKGVPKADHAGGYSAAGLGLGFRLLGMEQGFHSLDVQAVCRGYRGARTRLIVLDYGGTVVNDEVERRDKFQRYQIAKNQRGRAAPNAALIATLTDLCADPCNTVFVVSGKERAALSSILGRIPNLGLAAEHGFFYSWPSRDFTRRRWKNMLPDTDRSWRALALSIMKVYESRTHGSYIEETEMKVEWQYRDADPEFGYLQSKELEDHLQGVLKNFDVDILRGGASDAGYIEVRPRGVDKGSFLLHVLQAMAKRHAGTGARHPPLAFALALGDDHCDEPMLATMREVGLRARGETGRRPHSALLVNVSERSTEEIDELFEGGAKYFASDVAVFTGTVGKKPTAAANYLNDVEEVLALLSSLTKLNALDGKFHSAVDLSSAGAGGMAADLQDRSQLLQFTAQMETISAGMTRSSSMTAAFPRAANMFGADRGGKVLQRKSEPGEPAKRRVSQSISEFLHKIEDEDDEEEDEAVFF